MSGFFGKLALTPGAVGIGDPSDTTIATADSDPVESGDDWAVAGSGANVSLWRDGDDFCIVYGRPRIEATQADFEGEVASSGFAAACARRYAGSGAGFLGALEGPFCLVLHLARSGRTLLASDRTGTMALYYAAKSGVLVFATDLGRLPDRRDFAVSRQSIYHYLFFHFVPGPATIYEDVHCLPPGRFVEFAGGSAAAGTHWEATFTNETGSIDFPSARREIAGLLRDAVKETAEAGPFGCFLSGGIDSSTLAGIATEVAEQPVRTYSIGFDQQGFDEMEFARIAVNHYGTRHSERYVQPADIVRVAPRLAGIYGQPFGNSSVIPTYCCAEMARADGVTTMIAGDGGDELFGGNERYATQMLFDQYSRLPDAVRRFVVDPIAFMPGGQHVLPFRKLRRYVEQAREPMPDRLQTYNYFNMLGTASILTEDFLAAVSLDSAGRECARVYDASTASQLLNRMMSYDLKFTLADNDLRKVVQMCDAAETAVSFPFLDSAVLDFATRLPADQRVRRMRLRYFFKKAMEDFLPAEIIRKKKHGFGMPFGDWLADHADLHSLVFDSMSSLKRRGIVRREFIDELCDRRLAEHANYYGGFVWVLMVLELWLQWHESS